MTRTDPWQRRDLLKFFLIGADRRTRWEFGALGSGIRLHRPPMGLQGADFEHDWQPIVGMDGALYRGTRDQQAKVSMQVWVSDPRSSAWARRKHAQWRESLGRGKETCRLIVVSKESGYWWLDVRLENVSEVNYFDQSPGRVGEMGEIVNFVSDRAYWERFEETKIFTRATAAGASLANLGDQPGWLRYAITGTHSGITIGVGDDTVTLPAQVGANTKGYLIDTDELWPSILSGSGQDLQPSLPRAYWTKPLPPRDMRSPRATPLTIRPVNPGPDFQVEVSYTPRTEQAW